MLLEEGTSTGPIGRESTEIYVVPPAEQSMNIDHDNTYDKANEPELPVVDSDVSTTSSDEYDTAGGDGSGSESDTTQPPVNVPPAQPQPRVSRYGRIINPPQRYGFD